MRLRVFLTLAVIVFVCAIIPVVSSQTPSLPQQAPPPPTAVASPSPATETVPAQDVVRITTNLVQVDAVVTDKNGKPVTDLRPEEVRISEDGRTQKITNFSFILAQPAATPLTAKATPADKSVGPVPRTALHPDQVRRTIALVVDDLGLSFESTHFVRGALKKFVDEQMQPTDLVAIIRTSGGIGALQQFTSDKRQLYAAIERVRWYMLGRADSTPFSPIGSNVGRNDQLDTVGEDSNEFREDVFKVGTLGAVQYVVRGLKDLPGRKSILLISDGFSLFKSDGEANQRILLMLRKLVDEAGRASVVIYTMNATGLQTLMLTAADNTGQRAAAEVEQTLSNRRTQAFNSQEGLSYLAQETGGIAIQNNNDLGGGIKRVMEDQKGYYLIGYRPEESTFDPRTGRRTFHKLSLNVLRPGKFSVRMRNGFFGVTDNDAKVVPTTASEQILTALLSPFGSAAVHVRLTSLFANDAKLGSIARSMLHVNARDLTFTEDADGWHTASFDVVAVTFGDNGSVVDHVSRSHSMRVHGEGYEEVLKKGFVYLVTFPIKKPGAYQLRVAVRDHGSERVGSASQFIEVPDVKKNRLLLSSIVLGGTDPHKNTPTETTPASSDVEEQTADATNSAAVRQFHVGTIANYGVFIYNAHLGKNDGQPQLKTQVKIFRDGNPVFAGKEQMFTGGNVTDLKRIAAVGSVQLGADMAPGEYAFQIVVTDMLADSKHSVVTQWIDFEMVK